MENKAIFEKLDSMLTNPKSSNFLKHLVRAYLPVTKVEKVMDRPRGQFKCVITGDDLCSTQDILEGIHSETFKVDFMSHLSDFLDIKTDRKSAIAELVGEKKMGVTGKDTTTFMSINGFQIFYDWVVTKSFQNDKTINWLLSSIKRNEFLDRAETIDNSEIQQKVSSIKKKNDGTTMISTFTLGEIPALAKLREKFNV